jgi:hypothetical protein
VISSPLAIGRAPRNNALISRYEELRQQALGRIGGIPRGQGLALLMRGGIGAWMQAWAPCTVQIPAAQKERFDEDAIAVPAELHREVAMILAAMVLNGRQEATA